MHCSVDEAQERVSSARFTQWIAYQGIEPNGWQMDNWRFGMLAASVVNAVYSTIPVQKGRSRPKPLKPSDFYPPTSRPQQQPLTKEQAEFLRKKHGKRKR
jgi:hypothetical protein